MSGRLTALVLLLAAVSAAVGAAAALLLDSGDAPPVSAQPSAVIVQEEASATSVVAQPVEQEAADEQAAAEPQSVPAVQSETVQEAQPEPPQQTAPSPEPASQPEAAEFAERSDQQEQGEPTAPADGSDKPDQAEAEPLPLDESSLSHDVLTQGEAFSMTVSSADASAVAATISSRSWNLIEVGDGVWWGIVPVARDAATGSTEIAIDLYGEGGAWLRSLGASIIVLANAAPLEEVVLGGTGISADPAEVQRDHDVRFVEHVAVSGPAMWEGAWMLPVEGEVTGVFGAKRSYDGVLSDSWHHGHDIAANHGDPIVAPAAATVAWTGELVIHGIGVILDHGAGVYSGYWHMSLIAVREGMTLEAGDWIGNIGTTGLSTGPHLHWEVIVQGVDVDPLQWLGIDHPPLPITVSEPQ